jgi:hypothetical protein
LAELNHPYIVAVTDVGVTDEGNPYLVMEYVEGTPLSDLIKFEGKLSLQRTLDIMKCVCSAAHYAHERGIIHRDLKPSNIIVQPLSGEGEIAKVLDFGLAKFVQQSAEEKPTESLTQTGVIIGTIEYLSPEQCAGKKVDERSDIYALGVILYQMLTGVAPFTGDTPLAILTQHVNTPPPPMRDACPSIPAAVEWATLRALRKDSSERQQTALQLRQEFETAILHPERIPVEKTTEVLITGEFPAKDFFLRWRRHLLQPKFIAVMVVVIGLLIAFSAFQFLRSHDPQPWVITDPAGWWEHFALTEHGRLQEKYWNAPPTWSIVPGEEGHGDGALLVQGPGLGTLRPPEGTAIYDFSFRVPVTIVRGNKITWAVRYQGPKDYYLFELTLPKNETEGAQFQGYVYSQNYQQPHPFSPKPQFLDFSPPQEGDIYWIDIQAKGSTFVCTLTQDRGGASVPGPFTVQIEPDIQDQKYRYGTIGFGGLTDDGAVKIEYILLNAVAPQKD